MKSILYSVCIGTLALALTAGGAQAATDRNKQQERAKPQHRTANVQTARPATNGAMRTARSYHSTPQSRQRAYTAPRTGSNFVANRNARLQSMRERNFARNQAFHERTNAAFNRNRNVVANRDRSVAANRTRNVNTNRERNVAVNRTRNAEVRARNDAAVNRERNLAMNRTRNIDVNPQRNA